MKVSLNWVKQFTEIVISMDELIEKIGAQLGAVESIDHLGSRYKGAVIAKVVHCEKHPNADKLSLCLIDDGGVVQGVERNDEGAIQVVCGAPNVRDGLSVVWLPPGSTVPNSFDKDPFVLGSRELRGKMSNGMIASAHELGIGDDHRGIVEVDIEAVPGTAFADVYELNDYIIDIENKMFTHRPDCFGILGVAREIAGIQHIAFKSPDWYLGAAEKIKPGKKRLELEVVNEIPDLVPRFMAVALSDVEIKPSPFIIQSYLSRVGIKPINNIVDVTNYLMMLTGQPLHAYDYDKVRSLDEGTEKATIVVRKPHDDERIRLINGKEVKPRNDAAMIATATRLIGVGGVMGGSDTEVGDTTNNVILECANFDMYSIRRTSMEHGLFTDAVTRFNKGQSPLQNEAVLKEAIATLQFVGGGQLASDVIDTYESLPSWQPVKTTTDFINQRLGISLEANTMAELLKNVEFKVDVDGESIIIEPPYWRTDVSSPEDVVEEVGRLYGYDHLPLQLPMRTIRPVEQNEILSLKSTLRDYLSRSGANEVLSYSFVHGNLIDKAAQDPKKAYRLANALSPDLQYYRLSITPSLLDKVHPNIKAGFDEFGLFEIGKRHQKGVLGADRLPEEVQSLALVFATDDKTANESYDGAPYYQAKLYVQQLLDAYQDVRFEPVDERAGSFEWAKPYNPNRAAFVTIGEEVAGIVGEYKYSVKKAFKIPGFCAGFEIDLGILLHRKRLPLYTPLSRYPKITQDMTVSASSDIPHQTLTETIRSAAHELAPHKTNVDIETADIYKKTDDIIHTTYRFTIASQDRTLKATEVNDYLDKIAELTGKKIQLQRI
jgi:phenylalanyl-tRNA synthetase beta chain